MSTNLLRCQILNLLVYVDLPWLISLDKFRRALQQSHLHARLNAQFKDCNIDLLFIFEGAEHINNPARQYLVTSGMVKIIFSVSHILIQIIEAVKAM